MRIGKVKQLVHGLPGREVALLEFKPRHSDSRAPALYLCVMCYLCGLLLS